MNRLTFQLAPIVAATALATLLIACSAPGVDPGVASPAATGLGVESDSALTSPEMEPELAMETVAPEYGGGPVPRRGVVTAGDIDDGLNLAAFQRYANNASVRLGLPLADLSRPVLAQIVGPDGRPAPGIHITLRRVGAADPFYTLVKAADVLKERGARSVYAYCTHPVFSGQAIERLAASTIEIGRTHV